MDWYPKTKIGKFSFWVGISAFILVYVQYWLAMAFDVSIPILLGVLAMLCIVAAGVGSIIAITKYRDRTILLFVSALIGCLGMLFLLGEFLFPH
jgi:hypothetical protein